MQQQAAGRAANVEDKRGAGESSGLSRGAAARRRRGQDDDATIAETANISRFSSVRDRVEKANGMTVIQAIELSIYTLRTLRSDESAGYIALVRISDRIPNLSVRDTDGDDLCNAEIHMDGSDDFSCHIRRTTFPIECAHAAGTPPLACSAPSECVLSNSSATFASTVDEHAYVTTIVAVRVVHICSSKSWLTRTNATGKYDLQTANTHIPRKQSCSRYATVDDFSCIEIHEADESNSKCIPEKTFFLFEMS
jgi:hypothetical protein